MLIPLPPHCERPKHRQCVLIISVSLAPNIRRGVRDELGIMLDGWKGGRMGVWKDVWMSGWMDGWSRVFSRSMPSPLSLLEACDILRKEVIPK